MLVIDDARMLARIGVIPVGCLTAIVIKEGNRIGSGNAGHCRRILCTQ